MDPEELVMYVPWMRAVINFDACTLILLSEKLLYCLGDVTTAVQTIPPTSSKLYGKCRMWGKPDQHGGRYTFMTECKRKVLAIHCTQENYIKWK